MCLHALAGIGGALLVVWLFGRATYSWGLVRVRVSAAPALQGETAIVLTPIGEISARTHSVPLRLTLALDRLNLPALRQTARDLPDASTVLADIEQRAHHSLGDFAARLLLLALAGGLGASLLLLRGPWPRHALAAALGVAVVAALLAGTAATFRRSAFSSPRYSGPLAEAPGAIRFAREGLARLSRLRGRIDTVAASLSRFYASLEGGGPGLPGENDIRVLHVSDIHNNPLGVDFMSQFTQRFHIDLIVNTGDLTDYGTAAEQALLHPLRSLTLPQLFVAGNHDSQATLRALRTIPQVRVLDGDPVEADGIRFIGWPDPVSRREGYGSVDPTPADLDALELQIRERVKALPEPPDVLMVHSNRVAERLEGVAPVVLYGHNHRAAVLRKGGTVFVDAGTTGAAGARYFQAPDGVPYSAVVLHFSREHRGHLLAADVLQVRGTEGEFTLQRYTLNGLVKEPADAKP